MNASPPGTRLPRATHAVHSIIGTTLSAAIAQMIAETLRLVSRAAPITLDESALPR